MKTYRTLISEISYGPAIRPDHFAPKPQIPAEDNSPVLRPATKGTMPKLKLKREKFIVYVEDLEDEMASRYMSTFRTGTNKSLVKVRIRETDQEGPAQHDNHNPNNMVSVTYYDAGTGQTIEHGTWIPEKLIRFVLRFYEVEVPPKVEYKFIGDKIKFQLYYPK